MSAQVGVGISGHEGLQAVNASDFAIAQFRFLQRLLLVHGRWGYRRVAILVLYSFYKNACLAATLFLFCFFTGYSGTSLFSDYFTALFNFFLFLLIFYTSIFDQDVSVEYVYAHPQLYVSGLENKDLSVRLALQWILVALIHACIIFLLPAFALRLGTGERYDLGAYQPFGATISCGFIVYMNVKVRSWRIVTLTIPHRFSSRRAISPTGSQAGVSKEAGSELLLRLGSQRHSIFCSFTLVSSPLRSLATVLRSYSSSCPFGMSATSS